MITREQLAKARDAVDWFKQTLGAENFYLELQNHGIPEQAKVNKHLIPWAKEFGLKTMIGCMVETSLGIWSAMQLSRLAQTADLDGFLIVKDEPFKIVHEENGTLFLR